jgi:Zn-dependent M28 family amino/carboxypeptidase
MTRMLGIDGDELLKKIKPENFLPLSIAEQAPELREALLAANRSVGFNILYRESPQRLDRMSGGSDHSSFAVAGRPWAFFMSGMGDSYHTPGDGMERISGATMAKVSRLAFLAAYLLADR